MSHINRAYWLGPVLALALLPSNVVAAALTLLRAEWHASATEMGWVYAAYQLGYVLSVLFVLPLTDRVHISKVIAACALCASLSFVAFPFWANGVWSASLLRFFAGLGLAGIYMPGVRVIAATATPARRGFAVGAYVAAFYLGAAVSLWATGALLPFVGWRGAALTLGLISAIGLPLAVYSAKDFAAPAGNRASFDLRVMQSGPVRRNVLAYTGHSWELYVSRGWLAAFLTSVFLAQGMDAQGAAVTGSQWAALMAGCGTPGVFLGGWLSDHLGRARAALLMTLCSGLCSLIFGFLGAGSWSLLLLIGCLYGLLISADSAIYSTAITELAPIGRLGSAQAAQAFFGFSATIIAPVAAGLMLDWQFSWGATFALAGLIGLVFGWPLIYSFKGETGRRGDGETG